MTKKQLKAMKDNEIIYDYIKSYARFVLNLNLGGGTKSLSKHLDELDAEMLERGILTAEQIKILNS